MRLVAFVSLSVSKITQKRVDGFDEILRVDSVGTWTNWSTFEPDSDHSPDLGTGVTPDFGILAGYLNKLRADFDEI